MIRIGLTGHRENKISKDKDTLLSTRAYVHTFLDVVMRPHSPEETEFHMGGANGFDNWVGKWCLFNGFPIVLHLPFLDGKQDEIKGLRSFAKFEELFEKQTGSWSKKQKKELYDIVRYPNTKIMTEYTGYHSRDRGIVDCSDMIFAGYLSGGIDSGTGYTMKYALGKEMRVVNVFDPFTKITEKYFDMQEHVGFEYLTLIETILPPEYKTDSA